MSRLSVWQSVPVNKSNRPILTENEHNIFVKDSVGIYQGRAKIVNHQNGRVYLTNKRIIYIDSTDQQRAIAANLADALRAEFVERFLRSSPKVKVYLKTDDPNPEASSREQSPGSTVSMPSEVDWPCVICSYNNHLSTKVDLDHNFPKCVSCGIPPSRDQILRALETGEDVKQVVENPDQCPKCTFINHPSMRTCELCGTELKATLSRKFDNATPKPANPLGLLLEDKEEYTNLRPYIKVSFRKGGETEFFGHVQESIDKIKWDVLESRGGVSDEATRLKTPEPTKPKVKTGGIHSLERIGEQQRKQNEVILTSSLEDLEQLMYKAKDLIQLTSTFGTLVKRRKITNTIPPLSIKKTSSFYHQELARHMCEYLLSFELTKTTSMITLQDLFASYNRHRIHTQGFGTELVPTEDFTKCVELLDKLELPIKLKTYKSGLEVITQRVQQLQEHLHWSIMEFLVEEENRFKYDKFRGEMIADTDGYMRDQYRAFHGNTVAEIADHFGWSYTVCIEEMDRCMEELLVVYDRHVLGTFFFVNKFNVELAAKVTEDETVQKKARADVFGEQKEISAGLRTQYMADQNLVNMNNYEFGGGDVGELAMQLHTQLNPTRSDYLGDLAGLDFKLE